MCHMQGPVEWSRWKIGHHYTWYRSVTSTQVTTRYKASGHFTEVILYLGYAWWASFQSWENACVGSIDSPALAEGNGT